MTTPQPTTTTTGPSLRQKPGDPKVVEIQEHPGGEWQPMPDVRCASPAAARGFILAYAVQWLRQREERTQ